MASIVCRKYGLLPLRQGASAPSFIFKFWSETLLSENKKPKNIIGVADGEGDMKYELNRKDKNNINQVKKKDNTN